MATHRRTTLYPASAAVLAVLLVGIRPALAGAQEQRGWTARDSVLAEFSFDIADLQQRVQSAYDYMGLGITGNGGVGHIPPADSITVVEPETPVRAEPREDARTLRTLDKGAGARLLSAKTGWYEVLTTTADDRSLVGWLPARAARLEYPQVYAAAGLGAGGLWASVIEKARDLRDKYENNPYIRVTGFDVEIGLPPSITVGFVFK